MHKILQKRFQISRLVVAFSILATLADGQDVLTSRNDVARSGLQPKESILTPANVSTSSGFTLLDQLSVDGQVYAQPLYVSAANVYVNGVLQGKKNLLIVATENDSVYCYPPEPQAQTPKVPTVEPEPLGSRLGSSGTENLVDAGIWVFIATAMSFGTSVVYIAGLSWGLFFPLQGYLPNTFFRIAMFGPE